MGKGGKKGGERVKETLYPEFRSLIRIIATVDL